LRRTNLLAFVALGVLAALTVVSQADALQAQKALKFYSFAFTVTPSPSPVGFAKPAAPANPVVPTQVAQLVADPFVGPAQVASADALSWDVAPGATMIAQSSVQPTPVPVQFVTKSDPNAAFLQIFPQAVPPAFPYGTTVIPCAFKVFTFYTNTYKLVDWGQGTVSSGGTMTFPVENYPTASYLSWAVPDFSTTTHTYSNSGAPGETTWAGNAHQSQTHCIDLTLNVPASQPAGAYQATIQYTLYVTLP